MKPDNVTIVQIMKIEEMTDIELLEAEAAMFDEAEAEHIRKMGCLPDNAGGNPLTYRKALAEFKRTSA